MIKIDKRIGIYGNRQLRASNIVDPISVNGLNQPEAKRVIIQGLQGLAGILEHVHTVDAPAHDCDCDCDCRSIRAKITAKI